MIERLHDSAILAETMNRAYMDRLIEEHCSGRQNHNHVLWALLNVAIWHDRFFAH
jgi:asparagine synthase (glutamine-hydrolysing)